MNINRIAEIIKERGYEAVVHEVTKGSIVKMGISVGTGTVRPTIYPDSFTGTDEEIADKIIEVYENHETPNFDTSKLTDINYIKENMFVEMRRPISDYCFTKDYLDMQLVLRVKVHDIDGFASYRVDQKQAEQLGFDESIFDEAIKNTTFKFNPMGAVIGEMMGDNDIPDCGMYIVSNDEKMFGASVIFDKIYLKSIADLLNSDLVIIPSSIHEIIIVKGGLQDVDYLNQMVVEVNETQVEEAEQLSDHVYIFEKETGIIKF